MGVHYVRCGAGAMVLRSLARAIGKFRMYAYEHVDRKVCCNTSGRRAGTARNLSPSCFESVNSSFHPFPYRSLILYLLSTKQVTTTPNLTRAPIHKSLACPEGRINFLPFPHRSHISARSHHFKSQYLSFALPYAQRYSTLQTMQLLFLVCRPLPTPERKATPSKC